MEGQGGFRCSGNDCFLTGCVSSFTQQTLASLLCASSTQHSHQVRNLAGRSPCAGARVERVIRGSLEGRVVVVDASGRREVFDDVVFACGAEEALRMLERPSWCVGYCTWQRRMASLRCRLLVLLGDAWTSHCMHVAETACPLTLPALRSDPAQISFIVSLHLTVCTPATATAPLARLERRLLRNVEYFNDLIITHRDEAYMQQ